VEETSATYLQGDQPGNRTEQDPPGPRNSNHDTQSNHDWVGELFLFGASQYAYRAVERHARKRLRQWLCAKHQLRWPATKQYPAGAAMHQVLGLVQLTVRTSSFPSATPSHFLREPDPRDAHVRLDQRLQR